MATSLLGLILALLLPISAAAGPLSLRLEQWPSWQLPAPLPRPSPGDDLIYPAWFEGDWQLSSSDGISAEVHFERRADGAVVGTRAANAMAIGQAVLGDELLEVQDDPGNPNRQLARLSDDRVLDTRISGRRSETPNPKAFLADELSLQLLRQGGAPPRISRIETLSSYKLLSPDQISGEQWQASYGSPEDGLAGAARSSQKLSLMLERLHPTGMASAGVEASDPSGLRPKVR